MSIAPSADFLQQHAQSALSSATSVANRIASYTSAPGNIDFNYSPQKPDIKPPPGIGDLLGEDTKGGSIQFLNSETEKWLEKYFPNLASTLKYQPEEWANGILAGQQPFGLSREVIDSVWHQGRDRAYRTAESEKARLRAGYSLRGFSMPPGAMVASERNAEIRASQAIAEVNRQQILRDAEIKIDLVKFAASTAAQLKLGIMQSLATFHNQWIQVMNRDVDIARSKAQAYASLNAALSSFYDVELKFEQLRMGAATGRMEAQVQNNRSRNQDADARAAQNQALARAASAFADISASAANAQGSLQAELYSGQVS